MTNPFSHLDGMQAMSDPLGFIKKLWGGLNVPGVVTPPMSVEELDKKIQDLKTVESWLTVNMNMLRATIQGLEVQRATITALQNLGESFAEHAKKAGGAAEQMASSFAQSRAASPGWPMPEPVAPEQTATAPETPEPAPQKSANSNSDNADATGAASNFTSPAAWWGMMQDQFKAAVDKTLQAMPQTAPTSSATTAAKSGDKSPDKSVDKSGDQPAPASKAAKTAAGATKRSSRSKTTSQRSKSAGKTAANSAAKNETKVAAAKPAGTKTKASAKKPN